MKEYRRQSSNYSQWIVQNIYISRIREGGTVRGAGDSKLDDRKERLNVQKNDEGGAMAEHRLKK